MAGSCHGGSTAGAYDLIERVGYVPFDTCLAYEACSTDSTEAPPVGGSCAAGRDFSCTPANTCLTCSTFAANGGFCSAISVFPNASVGEYGRIDNAGAMMAEIYARGPIACSINASPLHVYTSGILKSSEAATLNHAVSVYGWGEDAVDGPYWKVRNSWGQYWGEMGSFRISRGGNTLGLESHCVWGTPAGWTEFNTGCFEDGSNCVVTQRYPDPGSRPAGLRVPHGAAMLAKTAAWAAAAR